MVVEVPPAAMEELADVSRRLVAQGVTVDTCAAGLLLGCLRP